jgi:hypothetical protein
MKIFLITPFREQFEDIYEVVKLVTVANGHSLSRADDFLRKNSKSVKVQAEEEIAQSDIVIADISNYDKVEKRTNNVRTELIYAQGLGKPIIPICSRDVEIPFDLSNYQTILYDRLRLQETLIKPLLSFLNKANPQEFLLSKKEEKQKKRKSIFVSYSHNDSQFLERLKVHLKPFEKNGQIDLWADTNIKAGDKWKDKINEALENSVIAILLISADFLASDFIIDNELPPLLKAAEEKGKIIISVIVKPCRFGANKTLAMFQAINDPKHPLSKLNENDKEEVYVKIAERIDNLVQ